MPCWRVSRRRGGTATSSTSMPPAAVAAWHPTWRSWPGTEDGLARPAAARSVRRDLADLDDLLPAREFTGLEDRELLRRVGHDLEARLQQLGPDGRIAHLSPSLTMVQVDGAGIGTRAAQLLLARCRGESAAPAVVDVGFRVVERGST
ncbi:substrate-binding domain-containing protein [Cupriavidus sp. USMAHM13]|uniref:substrate-binding domain-containing protein n=1 Tax=Cupriavidus sp. USMAHM13 TaxID=1389192 RepID=UPI0009F2AA24